MLHYKTRAVRDPSGAVRPRVAIITLLLRDPRGPDMTLAQEDIQFIKDHIGAWLAEQSLGKPPAVYEIELRERMVRVEEELKHQRELMREGFVRMDERFEAAEQRHRELRQDMFARFEQVDKRFEQVDRRFEGVQQDIRELQRRMDRFMVWSFGTTLGVGGLVVTLVKFWNP
jgi:ABC-type phosphate transport system auxiliary subunit